MHDMLVQPSLMISHLSFFCVYNEQKISLIKALLN